MSIALAGSIGLHWVFLQTVAWAGMVATYSRDSSLTEAVSKTFDGKHPCRLCLEIAKSKEKEKKSESLSVVKKFEFVQQAVTFSLRSPGEFPVVRTPGFVLTWLPLAPPTPPPRVLA